MAPITELLLARDDALYSAAYLAQDKSPKILAITTFFCFLALVVVSMRIYVRGCMVKFLGWDDVAIIVTTVLGVGVWVCFIEETHYGLGRHRESMTISEAEALNMWKFCHSFVLLFAVLSVKIAVALLLLRVTGSLGYRRSFYAIIGFMSCYTLVYTGILLWACDPISADWKAEKLFSGKCTSEKLLNGLGIPTSVFNMITDAILALFPIIMVSKLQLNIRTKIAVCLVLSLGIIAVICGGVKTHYQWIYFSDLDHFYEDNYFVWAALELYTGIIVASLPTLKPLMGAFLDKARTTLAINHVFGMNTPEVLLPPPNGKQLPQRRLEPIMEWEDMSELSISRPTKDMSELSINKPTKNKTVRPGLLHLDSMMAVSSIRSFKLHRPPRVRQKSLFDGTKGNPNYEIRTFCSRWDSIDSTISDHGPTAPSSHDLITSLPADYPFRSFTGRASLISPQRSNHCATSSTLSAPAAVHPLTTDHQIFIQTKVRTMSEAAPSCPSAWMPSPTSAFFDITTSSPPRKQSIHSTHSCPIARTFRNMFRRQRSVPHVIAMNDVKLNPYDNGNGGDDWDAMESPTSHAAPAVAWRAADSSAPEIEAADSTTDGLSEKGSENEFFRKANEG